MLVVTAKELTGKTWTTLDVPVETTDRIIFLKTLVGRDVVVKIQSSCKINYLCGTEKMANLIKRDYPDAMPAMDCQSAYDMLQVAPEIFITTWQLFTPNEVATVFPPKRGWQRKEGEGTVTKCDFDRYFVQIGTGDEYLVDTAEFGGNGFCGCKDFQYRLLPILEKEFTATQEIRVKKRCKHINYVFDNLLGKG